MTDPIRILLADDHDVVRNGLRLFLELQPDFAVVGEAADGREAVERTGELTPDLVLMDVAMPQVDGIRATEELHERFPDTRVLVLSSFGDDERVLPALRAGAAGYLLKQSRPEDLADAIRAVHRGEPVLCREAVQRVLGDVRNRRRRPEGTVTVLLTDIEGSTRLVESLGEERAQELFRAHDELVRAAAERRGGVEVEKEGDSFMLAFASARGAVRCAADIQRRLAADGPTGIAVRIGLNTGEVVAERDRYFGKAVFVASRIAGKAAGGEILASEITRRLAPDGTAYRDRGRHVLRGLKGEHRLFEVEWTRSPS